MNKLAHTLLLVGTVGIVAAYAQTNPAVTNAPADWTNTPAATVVNTNELVAVADTNAVAVIVVVAVADTNAAPAVVAPVAHARRLGENGAGRRG